MITMIRKKERNSNIEPLIGLGVAIIALILLFYVAKLPFNTKKSKKVLTLITLIGFVWWIVTSYVTDILQNELAFIITAAIIIIVTAFIFFRRGK